MRSDKSGSLVVKPCKQAEVNFYETTAEHPDFQYYLPQFIGTLAPGAPANLTQLADHTSSHSQASQEDGANAVAPVLATTGLVGSRDVPLTDGASATPGADAWIPSGGAAIAAENYVILENVAHGFEKPNVLDVKLGRRLWADDAPLAKRQKLDKASNESTSASLGYRIAGMKTWQSKDGGPQCDDTSGYRKYEKSYWQSITVDTVRKAFEDYFFVSSASVPHELVRQIIQCFVDDLKGLQTVLEKQESRIYSSSLLFVYEGDGESLKRKIKAMERLDAEESDEATLQAKIPSRISGAAEPGSDPVDRGESDQASDSSDGEPLKLQALKLIDFAHATWTPGQGPDENMLLGIQNVVKVLEELLG